MKKITILCELSSELDFIPDNAMYRGEIQEIKTNRSAKSGRYESTLKIRVTQFARVKGRKKK